MIYFCNRYNKVFIVVHLLHTRQAESFSYISYTNGQRFTRHTPQCVGLAAAHHLLRVLSERYKCWSGSTVTTINNVSTSLCPHELHPWLSASASQVSVLWQRAQGT